MSTVTIRLNEEEEKLFYSYSKFSGIPLSTLFKKSLEEKIEDEIDIDFINEYEQRKASGDTKYVNHNEVKRDLGI